MSSLAHRPPVDPWARRYPDTLTSRDPIDYSHKRIDERTKVRVADLYRHGVEIEHLAERFGIEDDTVREVIRRAGMSARRR